MAASRREFLIQSSSALASAAFLMDSPLGVNAKPLGRPAGLQLYSVMELLQKDFDGTLHQVRAIGYKEVEMAGFFGKRPGEIKDSLNNAGLRCRSVHIFGAGTVTDTMEYATAIGAKYVITSLLPPKRFLEASRGKKFDLNAYSAMLKDLALDDYKGMAEQCNDMGEQAKKAGLQLGYHNHNVEFKPLPGGTGYEDLLRLTDPDIVKLELDCGWMASAGHNPATYITKYPNRYRLLHIKDFKLTSEPSFSMFPGEAPEPTELGRGSIDYEPIFAAANKAGIEQYYVEQEPPYRDMPVLDAIKVDYAYVRKLTS
jgi:sugar phosphate isomerase/epimerase